MTDTVKTLRIDLRIQQVARVVCGLLVTVVAVRGVSLIATEGPSWIVPTLLGMAMSALFCWYAGVRAGQLRTEIDEATDQR